MKTITLPIAAILALVSASAQPGVAPGVVSHFSVTPIPFEQARLATETAVRPEVRPRASGGTPPEILELARALNNDPDLIYQYVHDNIEFSPLWGVLKGAVGTLLDGRGDAFDQAALMVALLNQASLTNSAISNVLFEYGQLHLDNAQLQGWLGVDSNPYSAAGVLAQGAIPATVYTDGSADVGHVWVQVSINGTAYVFDPAFKAHTWKTGFVGNLAGYMGYTQSQFVADGMSGATLTAYSIQNVNRTNLRNDLTTYANNLASTVRMNPTAAVGDLLGGGTIVPTPLSNGVTIRQTTNTNQKQGGIVTSWTTVPSNYYATLSVKLGSAAAQVFNADDIYGHRLSIFFSSSYVPTLYLDGVAVVSDVAYSQGTQVPIMLGIVGPSTWAPPTPPPGGIGANQTRIQYVSAQTNQNGGSGGYIVATGWDQVGRGMIEKHRTLLNQAIKSGAATNSELVMGESLVVLGYTWLAECAAQQHISDQLLGTTTEYFYGGGIVGESTVGSVTGPYVDLPLNFIDTPARVNGAQNPQTPNSVAAFLDGSGASSSFESASLEQTQAPTPGFVAASTVKLIDIALQNTTDNTIFDINNGSISSQQTYASTIRKQLNYTSSDLSAIDNYVYTNNYRVIAPAQGMISVGAWKGGGFKVLGAAANGGSAYGEIISGGLGGGAPGASVMNLPSNTGDTLVPASFAQLPQPSLNAPLGISAAGVGGDPIDLVKGSYQYRHEDLAVGAKSFPYGLGFERLYDSGAQGIPGTPRTQKITWVRP